MIMICREKRYIDMGWGLSQYYLSDKSDKPDDIIDRIAEKSFQHVSLSVNLPGVYFVE